VPIYSLYTMYKECETVFFLLYKDEQGTSTPEEAIQHLVATRHFLSSILVAKT
jgi:hypothetical protein